MRLSYWYSTRLSTSKVAAITPTPNKNSRPSDYGGRGGEDEREPAAGETNVRPSPTPERRTAKSISATHPSRDTVDRQAAVMIGAHTYLILRVELQQAQPTAILTGPADWFSPTAWRPTGLACLPLPEIVHQYGHGTCGRHEPGHEAHDTIASSGWQHGRALNTAGSSDGSMPLQLRTIRGGARPIERDVFG
jgi:hypothetical protein